MIKRRKCDLIGIGGAKRVGKDTVAAFLVEEFGFKRISFADPLKEIIAHSLDMSLNTFHNDELKDMPFIQGDVKFTNDQINTLIKKASVYETIEPEKIEPLRQVISTKTFKTPREVLQFMGTEGFRNTVKDSYWIDVAEKQMEDSPKIVFSDARFPNERMAIRRWGGTLMLIERPSVQKTEGSSHASESYIGDQMDYDVVVKNTSTIHKMNTGVKTWYSYIVEKDA